MIPSSTASTSIVALSVSISAITSPEATVSPSRTCHFASFPSVMVGDRAGIRTLILIGFVFLMRKRLCKVPSNQVQDLFARNPRPH